MSLNTSMGYIRVPRSLLLNPLFTDLPLTYQKVFWVLIELACYQPRSFDDHGKIIQLLPGQLCATEREIQEKCGPQVSKSDVHRSLIKFKVNQFVNQEVNHRKSVITITHPETYELIKNISEPRSESKTNHKLRTKELKEQKTSKQARNSVFFSRDSFQFENLTPDHLKVLRETFPHLNIDQQLGEMKLWLSQPANDKRDGTMQFITNWLKRCFSAKVTPIYQPEEENRAINDPYIVEQMRKEYESRSSDEHIL